MLFTLESLNAAEGDCLLLHHGTAARPKHILVDGGPRATYANVLAPRLRQLRALHHLGSREPLPLELVVLTHVDSDHVQGLLAMAEQLDRCASSRQPPPWTIEHLWHNSFDRITAGARPAAFDPATAIDPAATAQPERVQIASVREGDALRALADRLGIPQNGPPDAFGTFGTLDTFVMRPDRSVARVDLDDVSLVVLSPAAREIEALRREWRRQLPPRPTSRRAHGAVAAAAKADTSVTNRSSIALLVECGARSMLLAGDARADQLLAGLRAARRLTAGGHCTVDVFKLGHHGAAGNASPELLAAVRAKHYVISADGQHGNPDRETLDLLWQARGEGSWRIHTTFPKDAWKTLDTADATDDQCATLKEVQAWFDRHPKVKVSYRRPRDLGIRIDLGDETIA